MVTPKAMFYTPTSKVVANITEEGFELFEASVSTRGLIVKYEHDRVWVEVSGKLIRFKTTARPVLSCEQMVKMLDNPLYTWQLLEPVVEASDLEKKAVTALIKKAIGAGV